MTDEQGKSCFVLGEESCFYVSKSGLEEPDTHMLKDLRSDLQAHYAPNPMPRLYPIVLKYSGRLSSP